MIPEWVLKERPLEVNPRFPRLASQVHHHLESEVMLRHQTFPR